jgi:integrase
VAKSQTNLRLSSLDRERLDRVAAARGLTESERKPAGIVVAADERLSLHSLRHTYTSQLIVGLELDAATASKLAGHANPQVTMRVYADDFRKASDRNEAVLARAAERGFGT